MLVLTRDELKEITGASRKVKQRAELDALGIPYRVNADGWPVVDRQAFHQAMGGEATMAKRRDEFVMDLDRING